jgi:hypothetical protein
MSSEQLKEVIKTKVDLKSIKNIGINSIRKVRNNGLLIECNEKQECSQLSEEINKTCNNVCSATIPTKLNPRIIIYNIHSDKSLETLEQKKEFMQYIKDSIISRNNTIEDFVKNNESCVFECKFLIKSKNINLQHLIIEVSPQLRKLLLSMEKVNILWHRHQVKDFILITRCFKCLGFSHSKSKCQLQVHCSECRKEGHDFKTCSSESSHKSCINCMRYNQSLKPNQNLVDAKHDAFYGNCPSLKRIKSLLISKINYE